MGQHQSNQVFCLTISAAQAFLKVNAALKLMDTMGQIDGTRHTQIFCSRPSNVHGFALLEGKLHISHKVALFADASK